MAWRSHDPKAAGEDALQTGIARMLPMKDELKQNFLKRTPDDKIAYLLRLISLNALQADRQTWRYGTDFLPDKDEDATAPDPAEMWEARHTKRMVLQLAKEVMTDEQYDVFERRRRGEVHTVIAEQLGISEKASRKRLYDGLEKLKEVVSKRGLI
jgi:DNA-directed RNA polymerase specialized sigma24 family protein